MAWEQPGIPRLYRTEVEVAANAVIAMHKAGLLKAGVTVRQMAEALGVTQEDLRLASVRLERVPARRFAPTQEPTRAAPPTPMPKIGTKGRDPSAKNGERLPVLAFIPKAHQLDREHPGGFTTPEARESVATPYVPRRRYTEAGRKRAADRIFAEWRVRGNLDCSRCGKPIYTGSDAVIESAHHADRCP